ncbi:MAG: hypothetical protein V3W41_09675 [Planctomycetota bacterium]
MLATRSDNLGTEAPGGGQFVEHRQFSMRLLQSLGANFDDAEDVAQDVLLKFFSRGYTELGLEPGREKALLAKMTYSTFIDRVRRRKLRAALPLTDLAGTSDAAQIARITWVHELTALAGLTRVEIELLEDRFYRGLTLDAIASLRACHVNTIRRRLESVLDQITRVVRNDCPEYQELIS